MNTSLNEFQQVTTVRYTTAMFCPCPVNLLRNWNWRDKQWHLCVF